MSEQSNQVLALLQAMINKLADDEGGIITNYTLILERHDGEQHSLWMIDHTESTSWQTRGLLHEALSVMDQRDTYRTISDLANDRDGDE